MALPAAGSLQTILVVDDEAMVLQLVSSVLLCAGYVVLSSPSAQEALRISESTDGAIDLLLSDVSMPGMSGPELAKQLKELRPEMRVILMSGYPAGGMLFLNYGWYFVEKPFVSEMLLARVKSILLGDDRAQAVDSFDTRLPV